MIARRATPAPAAHNLHLHGRKQKLSTRAAKASPFIINFWDSNPGPAVSLCLCVSVLNVMDYHYDMENINRLSGRVVHAAYKVHAALGPGLLETVYEVCLAHELTKLGNRFGEAGPSARRLRRYEA